VAFQKHAPEFAKLCSPCLAGRSVHTPKAAGARCKCLKISAQKVHFPHFWLETAKPGLGHPVFREKIREWLKEMRKKNCAVILATQSLSDAANSPILDVLIESTPTKP
jgi:hypothetical protein